MKNLHKFLESISKEKGPSLRSYANTIIHAYRKEDIKRVIDVYENEPSYSLFNYKEAETYRVLFLVEKAYGKDEVNFFIRELERRVEVS